MGAPPGSSVAPSNTPNRSRRRQSGTWGAGNPARGPGRLPLENDDFGSVLDHLAQLAWSPPRRPPGGNSGGQPPPRQHYLLAISEQQIHASCGPTTPWMARRPSAGPGPVRSGSRGPLWTRPPSCPCHSMGSTQLHACLAGPCWPSLGRRRGTPHRCAADTLNPVQRSGERFVL